MELPLWLPGAEHAGLLQRGHRARARRRSHASARSPTPRATRSRGTLEAGEQRTTLTRERERELLFGSERLRRAVDGYDRARPEYPAELLDDLVAFASLKPGDRLLEIGCATGKATRPLLARGFRVTCVEPGAALAARARATLDADVHHGRFEDFDGPAGFDLVFAATAWHWLDPAVRFAKAHALLRDGGHLAFWSALHALPPGHDPFFDENQAVYDELGEGYGGGRPPPEAEPETAEIEASGLFADVQVRRYLWELRYSAEEYVALLDTFSGTSRWAASSARICTRRFDASWTGARCAVTGGRRCTSRAVSVDM